MIKILRKLDLVSLCKVLTPFFLLLTGSVLENMIF